MQNPVPQFFIGDFVYHARTGMDENRPCDVGHVTGFCPSARWVRVKTADGRYRIWLKENTHNVDYDLEFGNHTPRVNT